MGIIINEKNLKMNYQDFLKTKEKKFIASGFNIDEGELNKNLFDFQKFIVRIALKKGRFAVFAETGLGKTIMQLEWAYQVKKRTNKNVLILSPLAIIEQTIKEGVKFGININKYTHLINNDIQITNYEQLKNVDVAEFGGIVLDESSILKGRDGKTSRLLIDTFKNYQYKLCCSATPSPNDHGELGKHSDFLGVMSYDEMLSMFFVQDQKIKKSNKWRLRKHGIDDFWRFVSSWSISIDHPRTFKFHTKGYDLPGVEYIEHFIPVENNTNTLFPSNVVSATDLNKDLRRTKTKRINEVYDTVMGDEAQWIIWALHNDEANELSKLIPDSVNVQGSDKPEIKAKNLNRFANNEFRVLITKLSIGSMGLNFQNAYKMFFLSYNDSFERFYQGVRRELRFGQKNIVKVHICIPESQLNVRNNILEKEKKHLERVKDAAKYSSENDYDSLTIKSKIKMEDVITPQYELLFGDANKRLKEIDSNSIGYSFFSPPFKDLYVYSDDPSDMSNVSSDDEFYKHFSYMVPELFRVLKPGRLLSMHILQGTTSIGRDGFLSIKDFRGELIRLFQKHGFYFHAEKMIRKNPQLAAVRTKNVQLMHGQTKRDSSINRPGLADYILTFRKPGINEIPIQNNIPFDLWCKLAEPVWLDIDEGNVLKAYRKGRGKKDEKHMTPTQLDTIRNCYLLWSNKGDKILIPFGGVGSDGCMGVEMDRIPISIELKASYYQESVKNHRNYVSLKNQQTLIL